ncbi:MAG: hypothetical protein J6X94_02490 [Lachnospiraceae bacterium]|nr:hypothetical protein [Lachnospiraceae bacterium]
MNSIKKALVIILHCTWGIGPTLIGLFIFLKYRKYPHRIYRCSIETVWDKPWSGLSMGLFIFTPNSKSSYHDKVRAHEYGHCMQSLLLGPLMLFVGILSCIWGSHPYFVNLRKEKNIHYTSFFIEAWASKWGELVTGEEAIWD